MKKVLSVVLAALLMLSMTSVAFAADEQKPVAGVNLIKGTQFAVTEGFKDFPIEGKDLDYLVGAVFTVDEEGDQSFENFLVDFKLSVGETVQAEFYGKYGTGTEYNQWLKPGDYFQKFEGFIPVEKGSHHLFKEYGVQSMLDVSTVVAIRTFYCALYIDPNSASEPVNVGLTLDMYEKPAAGAEPDYEPVVAEDSETTVVVAEQKAPTAVIEMLPGKDFDGKPVFEDFAEECGIEDIDMNYVVGAYIDVTNTGIGYDNYYVDFILDLAESVNAKFFGSYEGTFGSFPWTQAYPDQGFKTIPAGQTNILSALNYEGSKMTVADASKNVYAFYCAFYVDPDTTPAPVSVSLLPAVYKAGNENEIEIVKETPDSVDEAKVALVTPVAGVTMVAGKDFEKYEGLKDFSFKGLNPDFVIGAILNVENAGEGFEDYIADFKLNLSADVKAKLYGQYGSYGWICATNGYQTVPAGDYYLLNSTNPLAINMSVAQITENVKTFYCAIVIDPDSVKEVVNAQLDVVMYETPEEGAPEFIVITEKDAHNSIEACYAEPTTEITMIPGKDFVNNPDFEDFADFAEQYGDIDLNSVVGAVLKVKDAGQGFEDYLVDFKLNLSEDVEARFFGKYDFPGANGWVGTENFIEVKAEDYYLIKEIGSQFVGEDLNLTVAEVVKDVKTFYCILAVNPEKDYGTVSAVLDVVMYEAGTAVEDTAIVLDDNGSDNSSEIYFDKPVVDIKLIPGRDFAKNVQFKDFAKESGITDLKMDCVVGAEITLVNAGEGFDNSLVDFKLGVSEAVDAMLYGKYYYGDTALDWTPYSAAPVTISEEDGLYVLGAAKNDAFEMTVSEVDKMVGTFYCVLVVDPNTAEDIVKVSLDTVVYDKPEAEAAPAYTKVDTTVGSVDSADVCRIRPVVDITMIDGSDFTNPDTPDVFTVFAQKSDFEAERVVGAVMSITDMGKFFENAYADFRLGLSDDVKAKVYGSYIFNEGKVNEETHAWTSLTGDEYVQFKAGDNYILGTITNSIESLTLTKVNENVGTFYCVFEIEDASADYEAINTTLDLVLYDEPADGAEVEYIAADCNTNNKSMVLGGWDILLNGAVDAADYMAAVNIALGNERGYSQQAVSSADVDGDGYVDVLDAVLVERIVNSK